MRRSPPPAWPGRLARLRSALVARQLDAFVVSAAANIRYLCGFDGSAGLLVVTSAAAILVADGRYSSSISQRVAAGTLAPVTLELVELRYDLTLRVLLERLSVHRVGFEASHVAVSTLRRWRDDPRALEWVESDDLIESFRAVKDDDEVATLRRAALVLSDVARSLPELVSEGATEISIARSIDLALERAGFSGPAFPTIVASGPNSALPHATPGDRRLAPGDLVVLDFGGVLSGYCVDLTRMAVVGRPSAQALALFEAVRDAQAAAILQVAPGATGAEVDAAARGLLEARGLGQAFLHGTGHGVGLEVHELPRLSRGGAESVLAAGMVCTIEPGAYLEGFGGVRLEDDVLVTDTGRDVLTDAPRDLLEV